jgi:hypothetical protein
VIDRRNFLKVGGITVSSSLLPAGFLMGDDSVELTKLTDKWVSMRSKRLKTSTNKLSASHFNPTDLMNDVLWRAGNDDIEISKQACEELAKALKEPLIQNVVVECEIQRVGCRRPTWLEAASSCRMAKPHCQTCRWDIFARMIRHLETELVKKAREENIKYITDDYDLFADHTMHKQGCIGFVAYLKGIR